MPSYKDLFPDRWLKAEVINGYRPRVTIEHVAIEQLFNPRSRKHENKLVVKFYKKELRLVCNKTQATALATICKTDDFSKWQGHEVVLSTSKAPNGMDTILISPVPDAPAQPAKALTAAIEEEGAPDDEAELAAMWDTAAPSTKSPDDITPAQRLRLTKLMQQVYGPDWGALEPKLASDASKGSVSQFSELKVKEAEVLLRKLEAGLAQVTAQAQNGKVPKELPA